MTRRYLFLALLLIGGVLVTNPAWAESSDEIQKLKIECDRGNTEKCLWLGAMYQMGKGVKQDFSKAADIFRKVCDGGKTEGCRLLMEVSGYEGSGTSKAQTPYRKDCEMGNAKACARLGLIYRLGLGVKEDYFQAADLFRKACDKGNADGCVRLGEMYRLGWGVKQDYFRAADLYRKACEGGEADGCLYLGAMYESGKGVKQSDTNALTYFGKACDLRDENGCKYYAELKRKRR